MGEFSKKELAIIDKLGQALDGQIEILGYDYNDNDRLIYAACLDDFEKDELTKKLIKKLQKKLFKCKPSVSVYVSSILNDFERSIYKDDFYSFREQICMNFISQYSEGIEELAEEYESAEEVEDAGFDDFIYDLEDDSYSFDTREVRHFIKNMAIAERLLVFREILSERNKEKTNSVQSTKTTHLTPESQTYVLQLLEDLSITVNGKYALSPKRKGAIRGVVEALREKNIVPNLSLEELNNAIASKIDLELKSKLDWSKTSDDYKMKTFKYIENKPFQKET